MNNIGIGWQIVLTLSGFSLSVFFITFIKNVYRKNMKISILRILITTLLVGSISTIFLQFFTISDTVFNIFMTELSASLLSLIVVALSFGVFKRKDYARFIISYYFCYLSYMLFYFIASGLVYAIISISPNYNNVVYFASVISLMIYFLFFLLVRKLGLPDLIERVSEYKLVSTIAIFLIVLDTFIISLSIKEFFVINTQEYAILAFSKMSITLFLLVATNIILIGYAAFMFINLERVKQQEMELLQQNLYIQKLENLQFEMRTFKHDYKNIMSSMYLQAEEGDVDSIQEYLSEVIELVDDRLDVNVKIASELSKIKNLNIKSSLLIKLMNLETSSIPYYLEIQNEVHSCSMSQVDFSRCLGILIDNAKEAVETLDDGSITIVLYQQDKSLHVLIKNDANPVVLTDIWKDGYSTKGDSRGHGLASYHQIVEKYDNVLKQTKYENGMFTQILSIHE